MPDPRKAEPYLPRLSKSGEIEISQRIKLWQKDWLDLIDGARKQLLPQIECLVTSLEQADKTDCQREWDCTLCLQEIPGTS
jgi:hypothetical protein